MSTQHVSMVLFYTRLGRKMPIRVVELEDGGTGYQCYCSACGRVGDAATTTALARNGFYPANVEEAFRPDPQSSIYLCGPCMRIDTQPTTEGLEILLLGHLGRFSPAVSLDDSSLAVMLIEILVHSRGMTDAQLADRVAESLRASPQNRERIAAAIYEFFGPRRVEAGPGGTCIEAPVLQLPKPLPDWCVEGMMVRHKTDGNLFRVGTISIRRVALHNGDEHIEFSRYESFGDLFEPFDTPSVWDLLLEEGEDDLLTEDIA